MLKKDKAKEISALCFANFDDFYLLVSTSWDSTLKVYDEEDPEESLMLRKSIGGHFKDDISSLAFCEHLSLMATGSRSGIICLWDFEMGKLEGICLGHKRAVSSLNFIKGYPLLVSTGICGLVCVWGVRPAPHHLRHVCIGRFINLSWNGAYFTNVSITSSFIKVVDPSC